jgi:ribonuclease HI
MLYKGFVSKELAEEAYRSNAFKFIGKSYSDTDLSAEELEQIGKPIPKSISVDGAWNTMTGVVEYRGVDTNSGKELFHVGPMEDGTNNVVEFLAIVHALAYCKQRLSDLPIYSDSQNAINWVRDMQVRTNLEPSEKNERLFELLDRALSWLETNDYPNEVLKWETKAWGENPADFGRK